MRVSMADRVRLGSDVAKVKSQLSKKQWRRLVKTAHSRGLTVRGSLQSGPDALKERLPSSLEKEATRTTATAYAPTYKELDQREQQIKTLNDLRTQDESTFREWLAQKQASLQSDARAADAALNTRLAQINADAINAWKQRQTDAVSNAQNAPGTVSNPAQSTALQQLANAAQASEEQRAANHEQIVRQSANSTANMSAVGAALLAATDADRVKRESETQKALNEVLDKRGQLKLQQAADVAKTLQGLQDREATKAQNRVDTEVAAQKLGVDMANLNFKKHQFSVQTKQANKKYGLDKWIAHHQDEVNKQKVALGYDQIAAQKGKAAADRKLRTRLEHYRQGQLNQRQKNQLSQEQDNPTPKPADRKQSATLYRTIDTVYGQILDLHAKYGDKGVTKNGRPFRAVLRSRGYDDTVITLAENIRRNNGKLNANGRRIAKQIGLLNPQRLTWTR